MYLIKLRRSPLIHVVLALMNKPYLRGVLFALAGAVLFSLKPVIIKLIYNIQTVQTIDLLLLRMLMSLPFYLGILIYVQQKKGLHKLSRKTIAAMILLGFIGFYIASFMDFAGLKFLTASLERVIIFLNPTIVLLLSAVFFKKKIKAKQWLAIALTYTGIVIAFASNDMFNGSEDLFKGASFVFVSAFCYAVYLIGSEIYLRKIGTLEFTCYTMIVAFGCIAIHYTLSSPLDRILSYDFKIYSYTFLMAILSTLIPSFLFAEGIKRIGAPNGSIVGGIGPVSTIIFAILILDESISLLQLIGTVLVIGGVLVISYDSKKKKIKR